MHRRNMPFYRASFSLIVALATIFQSTARATDFCGIALAMRNGSPEQVDVFIDDDDASFNNVGGGATEVGAKPKGTIDGMTFSPDASDAGTTMSLVNVDLQDALGTLSNKLALRYTINGAEFYVLGNGTRVDINSVTSLSVNSVSGNSINNIAYPAYGIYEKLPDPVPDPTMNYFCGKAFRVDRLGNATQVDVEVWDDDGALNDVGDGASEGGALAPVGRIGGINFTPNADHAQTQMALVRADITDALGVRSNQLALLYLVDGFWFYVVGNGTRIEVDTVSAVTQQSFPGSGISNIAYPTYGIYAKIDPPVPDPAMDRYAGKALLVNRLGTAEVVDYEIWDDDDAFNDAGDGAAELGALAPVGTIGGIHFVPNADHVQTTMSAVRLDFSDGLGTETQVLAVRYLVNGFYYYFLQPSRGVEFGSVSSVVNVSTIAGTVSNIRYYLYGAYGVSPLGQSGQYRMEDALRVDRDGGLDDTEMEIWDDDNYFSNVGDGDTEQGLDPTGLVSSCHFSPNASDRGTVIRTVEMDMVQSGGAALKNKRAVEYVFGGITYYLPFPSNDWNPSLITSISSVTQVNKTPVITSSGAASFQENTPVSQAVYTAVATDFEEELPVYSIAGGADAAFFSIEASTGRLFFISSPDFENPQDGNSNNVYRVIVRASDGQASATKLVLVSVTDELNEDPFANWIATFFPGVSDPVIIGPDADPDCDGLSNYFEFVYQSDPAAGSEESKHPFVSAQMRSGADILAIDGGASVDPAKTYFTARVRVPKNPGPASVSVTGSPNLAGFGSSGVDANRFGPQADDGFYWLEDYFLTPAASSSRRGFCRVEVVMP